MPCLYLRLIVLALLSFVIFLRPTPACPPSPELLDRLHQQGQDAPYFMRHEHELRASGVSEPTSSHTLQDYLSGTLDTDFHAIALCVDFSDHASQTEAGFFDGLLFGTQTGSLRHYYNEVSYGNLTVVTVNLPGALGWYRAPQLYSYYTAGQNGFGAYPQNAQRLTEDVIALADPYVDFSQYDNDGDDYVDALFIIHSGTGAELSGNNNDIWSHKWGTSTPQIVDGVRCYTYSMEPEFWQTPGDMTCGVYAHEMGHAAFGLPDLYDYGYDSKGLGRWSLMAGGSWNGTRGNSPSHPDAWSRMRMGFASPFNLTANQAGVALPAIETSASLYRLWTSGQTGNEFFLVENRRQTGYDTALPGQGLLVYHVDQSRPNNDNQWYPGRPMSSHYKVALEQADGLWELEHNSDNGDTGDPYPGSANRTTFDEASTPNSRSYANTTTYVAVRNISASAATMTADLFVAPGSDTPPSITVAAPNGGETWMLGSSVSIAWTSAYLSETVNVELNRSYPSGPWEILAIGTPNDGFFSWSVSGTAATAARIRVCGAVTTSVGDTSNANFAISSPPNAALTITVPNGGESWTVGTLQRVRWTSTNLTGNVRIELNRGYPNGTWETIIGTTLNDGGHSWIVTGAATANGRIRVLSLVNAGVGDTSNANFSISGGVTRTITVTLPNSGSDTLRVGMPATARWTSSNLTGYVRIQLNRNYPNGTWETVASATINDGIHTWNMSGSVATAARLRISSTSYSTVSDESDANFTIAAAGGGSGSLTVQYPNGGEVLATNSSVVVRWNPLGVTGYVRIQVNRSYPSGTWATITSLTTNDGSYTWSTGSTASTLTRIRVVSTTNAAVGDTSDANFTVQAAGGMPGADGAIPLPLETKLHSISPNPFNPTTQIRYTLAEAATVRLEVFDIRGRRVATLTDAVQAAGEYTVPFAGASLAAGTYFLRLEAGGFHTVQKLLLMK